MLTVEQERAMRDQLEAQRGMFALRRGKQLGKLRFTSFKEAACYILMQIPAQIRVNYVIVRI